MADETVNVKIKIDTSAATASASSLKNSFNSASGSAQTISNATDKIHLNLNQIKNLNLATAFSSTAKYFNQIKVAVVNLSTIILREVKEFVGFVAEKFNKYSSLSFKDYFELEDTQKGLKNLKNGLADFFKSLFSYLGKLSNLLVAALAVFTVKSAFNVAELGNDIRDSAKKVYMSETEYQEWGYVLKQNGIEISSLNTLMRTFSKNLVNNNGKFGDLVVTTDNINEAFNQAVEYIQSLKTETEKVSAATEIFGTRASELMPILKSEATDVANLKAEYRALGGTMSTKVIDASDQMNDSITALKAAFQGLKNTLAYSIMPYLTKLIKQLTLFIAKVNIFFQVMQGVSEDMKVTDDASENTASNFAEMNEEATKLKRTLASFDELQILNGEDSSISSDTSDYDYDFAEATSLSDAIFDSDAIAILNEFREKVENFKEWWDEWGWTVKLGAALTTVATLIGKITNKMTGKNKVLQTQTDLTKKESTVLSGAFVAALAAAAAGVGKLVSKFKDWAGEHLPELTPQVNTAPAFSAFNAIQVAFIALASLIATPIFAGDLDTSSYEEGLETIETETESTRLSLADKLANLKESTVEMGVTVATAVSTKFNEAKDSVVNRTSEMWNSVKTWCSNTVNNVTTSTKNMTNNIRNWTTTTASNIKSWASNTAANVRLSVSNMATNIYNGFTNSANNIAKWVSSTSGNIASWAKNAAKSVGTFCSNMVSNIKSAVKTGVSWLGQLFEGVGNFVSENSGAIIAGVAAAGVAAAAIALAPYTGGASLALAAFKNGGVLTTPTVGLMGEYAGARTNPEIVTPENLLQNIISANNDDLANTFIQCTRQIISAVDNKDMEVSIGDDVIAKSAARGNNAYKARNGVPLFSY